MRYGVQCVFGRKISKKMDKHLPFIAAGLLLFLFLWKRNYKFRHYIKFLYFGIFFAFYGLLVIPILIWRPCRVENCRISQWIWIKMFIDLPIFRLDYEIRDGHRLEVDTPCVIVCNHQSSLDVIGLMRCSPKRCSVLIKRSLMYLGVYGLVGWLSRSFYVDRTDPQKAKSVMKNIVKAIKNENIALWVFPEGTRSMKDQLQSFKKGTFNIAIEAQVPVIPIVFSSYKNFYDEKRKILEPGKIIVQCLPPISTEGLTAEDVPDLTNRVRSKMNEVFANISKDLSTSHEFDQVRQMLTKEQ